MTAGERIFIELQLKAAWRNLERQKRKKAALEKRNPVQRAVKPLLKEIEVLGNQYIRDLIYSGMGTYVLAAEKEKMFDEIGLVMNRPEIKEKFRAALYQNGDLEEIRRLSMEIREQVEQLIKKYEAHAK
ncbi:hypothetical protein [Hungatella hathewayi]|uniref:hypothetical protein n=1 Tax=Hungatella hathewayi TaxID=154046 RepID=UPI001C038DFE|nr:hypothetical protein [Hungatella hathewayi]MBT9795177.1 hypothetical protein [Hungatella hathewayi]